MVTFETKCYENDWEFILTGSYLEQMINRCNYPFDTRQLIVNNVIDRNTVSIFAQKKIDEGVIDKYIFTEDYAEEVLKWFNLSKEDLGKGYPYSISELTGIYICNTKYLLHFASDSFISKKRDFSQKKEHWIDSSIRLMSLDSDIVTANPLWNNSIHEAEGESITKVENFWKSFGFSDQCYLIPTEIFKKDIYKEKNKDSERYPVYGGDLFEKRVDSFLRNKNFYRITSCCDNYIHSNFPKSRFNRKAYLFISNKLNSPFSLIFRKSFREYLFVRFFIYFKRKIL